MRNHRRFTALLLATTSLLAAPGFASGFSLVSFRAIDFPGAVATQAWGINNNGDIVGFFFDGATYHGFLLSGGTFTQLDAPGASFGTLTYGINNNGSVVGAFSDSSGTHGFILNNNTYSPVDFPGQTSTQISGTNDLGSVAGWVGPDRAPLASGIIEDGITQTQEIGLFSVGFATFLVRVPVDGAQGTRINGIDKRGDFVGGYIDSATGPHGFLQILNGPFTTIDADSVCGGGGAQAFGINSGATVVGACNYFATSPFGPPQHGFVFSNGVYNVLDVPAALTTTAKGINDQGVIVGDFTDSTLHVHGFVRVTVPLLEISTVASLLVDINNSLLVGLIDNAGVAASLSNKVAAAQNASLGASCSDSCRNILKAFENDVNAQTGKHITPAVAGVLLQDVNSIVGP